MIGIAVTDQNKAAKTLVFDGVRLDKHAVAYPQNVTPEVKVTSISHSASECAHEPARRHPFVAQSTELAYQRAILIMSNRKPHCNDFRLEMLSIGESISSPS